MDSIPPPPDPSYIVELLRRESLLEELLADEKFSELGKLMLGFIHQLQREALELQQGLTKAVETDLEVADSQLRAHIARFEEHAPTFYIRQLVRDSAASDRLPDDFWESIEAETERAVILVSSQAVDNACFAALEAVRQRTKSATRRWRRPSFVQAVAQCAELGIVDEATETAVHHVREIRNKFAHNLAMKSISVDGTVRRELQTWFATIQGLDYAPKSPRVDRLVFARGCIVLVLRMEYARQQILAGRWPDDCPITASAPEWTWNRVAEEWARWFQNRLQAT